MSHNRIRYASNMTDAEWELIKPMLPLARTGPGRPLVINMREAVNAMFYVGRTGCQWENLPKEFPPAGSVYYHFNKWSYDGTWRRLNAALGRRERCPSADGSTTLKPPKPGSRPGKWVVMADNSWLGGH